MNELQVYWVGNSGSDENVEEQSRKKRKHFKFSIVKKI